MAQRNKKYIYVIILTNHGKQLKTICNAETDEKIHKKLDKLLKENKKVAFPIQFNNHKHVMVEAQYELVIIKCKQDGDDDVQGLLPFQPCLQGGPAGASQRQPEP